MRPHAHHRPSSPGLRPSSFQPLASLFILLFSFACAAAPAATSATPTPPPPPTSASDNPTAGAARRLTQAGTQAAAASQDAVVAAQLRQTAQAAGTVQAQATGQAMLAAKDAWPQRLLESFADNQLGWPTGLTADHSLSVTTTIADGQYQWLTRVVNGNSYFNLLPSQGPVLTDFYAQVSVTFGAGNDDGHSAYGLAFRHVKDDYGFFGILKYGGFRLLEVHNTGIYQTVESSSTAFDARPGASNRLGVVAAGSDFVFLINDRQVGQMHADFDPGQIGLGIDTLASAGEARVNFSEFQINTP